MAYDLEPGTTISVDRKPDPARPKPHPQDLGFIVTMLELAALALTTKPDSVFTRDQLVAEVRDLCGDELMIAERDLDIVLQSILKSSSGFLKKAGSQLRMR